MDLNLGCPAPVVYRKGAGGGLPVGVADRRRVDALPGEKIAIGRHLGGAAEVIKQMGEFYPAKRIDVSWPTYADVMKNGVGFYLHDPANAPAARVFRH